MSLANSDNLTLREFDCLLAVESLSHEGWPARLIDIAEALHIRPPSAVELVNKLIAKKLLERGPSGIRLASLGTAELREMHRAHRLLEIMLLRIGMKPAAACVESKRIDRYSSRELVRALCKYLGHPATCPHNMPIEPDPRCCPRGTY